MSTITTTHPPLGYELERPPVTVRSRAYGFWGTLGWLAVAVAAMFAAAILYVIAFVVWVGPSNFQTAVESPVFLYLGVIIATPTAALVLMLAARRAGPSATGYLGLTRPQHWQLPLALGMLVATWVAFMGLFHLFPAFDEAAVLINEYRGLVANLPALVLFWIMAVIAAPVAEEIIFRGFVQRGFSASFLGVTGGIVLASLLFALAHIQYNMLGMAMTFCLGLACGIMRWRTGSLFVPILMHGTWNLACCIYYTLSI